MFQAELDQAERLLTIRYSGQVDAEDVDLCLERVKFLLADVEPGYRVLADISDLEEMEASCALGIGSVMNFLLEKRVERIVRVVPDPKKDIGFNLIGRFHYSEEVRSSTVETLDEAAQSLAT